MNKDIDCPIAKRFIQPCLTAVRRINDSRFKPHHWLTILSFFFVERKTEWDHQFNQSFEDRILRRLDDVCVHLIVSTLATDRSEGSI